MTTNGSAGRNQLGAATSPYLRQHAHHPVHWQEWGPAALEEARALDRPVFLSIGYAACHWCHVMAHESFANPALAAVMNEHFVNIKVDREERPDLDEVYMQATLALNNGQGGWPMSVWLTPDLKPFFAGTYFPPVSRHGRPGFKEICQRIGVAWQSERPRIEEGAEQLTSLVRAQLQTDSDTQTSLDGNTLEKAVEFLIGVFDRECGGIVGGGTNKFPPSMSLGLLMRVASRHGDDDPHRQQLMEVIELTLERMATGGIYDQIGGGIHRYSTDRCWHVPHFEKMLYDQALVSSVYLDAYQLTGKELYGCVAAEILDYVLRDLRGPEGGFYSSRDADSEGEEGKYYVWTRPEVIEILGREAGERFCNHYDITAGGNWHDPHNPAAVKSIPRVLRDMKICAKLHNIDPTEFEQCIIHSRAKLLAAREQRVAPGLDDKILCEWNGLMIASLARAGSILDQPEYITAAEQAAQFILGNMMLAGRLRRAWHDGRVTGQVFLSDYAALIDGLIELYEATFEQRWLAAAESLSRVAIRDFWDESQGGFFFTASDHEPLIARIKHLRDGALPSGNSLQLLNMLRLAVLTGDEDLCQRADQMLRTFATPVQEAPWAAERFLVGVDFSVRGPVLIVIVGDAANTQTRALLRSVYRAYVPNMVLMVRDPAGAATEADLPPSLRDRARVNGQPTAYVCWDGTCQTPVTNPEDLAVQLARV